MVASGLEVQTAVSVQLQRSYRSYLAKRSVVEDRMIETHLSVFHSISNHAQGKCSRNSISSAARYAFNSFLIFL